MKKTFAALCFMTCFSAQAQFMGIDDIPVKDSEKSKLLVNAIVSKDIAFINNWEKEKGLKFPYDGEYFCLINNRNKRNDSIKLENRKMDDIIRYLELYGTRAYFTHCDNLPIFNSMEGSRTENSATFFKYNGGIEKYLSSASPHMKNNVVVNGEITHNIMDNLAPEQWDQLVPIIVSNDIDFELRKKALKMFLANYKNMNKLQTEYMNTMNAYFKTAKQVREEVKFLSVIDPVNYIFNELAENFLLGTAAISRSKIELNIPKSYWLEPNAQLDWSNAGGRKSADKIEVLSNAYLLKEVMNSPDYNMNLQLKNGNTFLHGWVSAPNRLEKNRLFANFIRALLEKGMDYKLLNKDGETFYTVFEKRRDKSSRSVENYEPFIEAVRNKEYNY